MITIDKQKTSFKELTKLFNDAGMTNLKFGGVNGHLFMIGRKEWLYEWYNYSH